MEELGKLDRFFSDILEYADHVLRFARKTVRQVLPPGGLTYVFVASAIRRALIMARESSESTHPYPKQCI